MRRSKRILRALSFILLQSFIVQQVSYADVLAPLAAKQELQAKPAVGLTFPGSVASIEDAYKNGGDKLFYLIQDAHTNESGQLNLSKALDLILEKEKDIQYVFTEAGLGDDSLSFLKPFRAAQDRDRIAQSYIKKGMLHGHEYLNLMSERDFTIWGVENPDLYALSVELYRQVAQERTRFDLYLKKIESTTETLKDRLLNPALQTFDQERKAYREDHFALTAYFTALWREAILQKISLASYPHLLLLKSLKENEEKLDFSRANEEHLKAVQGLSQEAQAELKEFTDASENKADKILGHGQKETQAYFLALEEKLKQLPPASPLFTKEGGTGGVPELTKYFEYLELAKGVEAKEVLKEIESLENAVLESLSRSEDEKMLIKCENVLFNLKKLFHFTLTPEEYASYKAETRDFTIEHLTGFLNKKIMDLGAYHERSLFLEEGYDETLKRAEGFYELTKVRDEYFIQTALEKMDKSSARKAVLVTGGFHTANLKALLKEKGISFISVTPKVWRATNLKKYESVLLGQTLKPVSIPVTAGISTNMTQMALVQAIDGNQDANHMIRDLGNADPGISSILSERSVSVTEEKTASGARLSKFLEIFKTLAKFIRGQSEKSDLTLIMETSDLEVKELAGTFNAGTGTAQFRISLKTGGKTLEGVITAPMRFKKLTHDLQSEILSNLKLKQGSWWYAATLFDTIEKELREKKGAPRLPRLSSRKAENISAGTVRDMEGLSLSKADSLEKRFDKILRTKDLEKRAEAVVAFYQQHILNSRFNVSGGRKTIKDSLVKIGTPAVPVLIDTLSKRRKPQALRGLAVDVLSDLAHRDLLRGYAEQVVEVLENILRNKNTDVLKKHKVIKTLFDIGTPSARKALESAAKRETDPLLILRVSRALKDWKSNGARLSAGDISAILKENIKKAVTISYNDRPEIITGRVEKLEATAVSIEVFDYDSFTSILIKDIASVTPVTGARLAVQELIDTARMMNLEYLDADFFNKANLSSLIGNLEPNQALEILAEYFKRKISVEARVESIISPNETDAIQKIEARAHIEINRLFSEAGAAGYVTAFRAIYAKYHLISNEVFNSPGARLSSDEGGSALKFDEVRLTLEDSIDQPLSSRIRSSAVSDALAPGFEDFFIAVAFANQGALSQSQGARLAIFDSATLRLEIFGLHLKGKALDVIYGLAQTNTARLVLGQKTLSEASSGLSSSQNLAEAKIRLNSMRAGLGDLTQVGTSLNLLHVIDAELSGPPGSDPALDALLAQALDQTGHKDKNFRVALSDRSQMGRVLEYVSSKEDALGIRKGTLTTLFDLEGFKEDRVIHYHLSDSAQKTLVQEGRIHFYVQKIQEDGFVNFALPLSSVMARVDKEKWTDPRIVSAYRTGMDPKVVFDGEAMTRVVDGREQDSAVRGAYSQLPLLAKIAWNEVFRMTKNWIQSVGRAA